MINYPKIQSLFKRDPATNYKTFLPEYSLPEFEYLKDCQWEWVEKIDGTNIRLSFEPFCGRLARQIEGRSDKSTIPDHLFKYLFNLSEVLAIKLCNLFDCPVTLYGEGYGAKINGGEQYRDDVSFILFDIRVGHTWLRRKDIIEIGGKLGIDVAPTLFTGDIEEATVLVAPNPLFPDTGLASQVGKCYIEGVVGQPVVPLLTRMGKRIITKLKTKDFQND